MTLISGSDKSALTPPRYASDVRTNVTLLLNSRKEIVQ